MDQLEPNSTLSAQGNDLVYSFCSAPALTPEENTLLFSARNTGLFLSKDEGKTWGDALKTLNLSEPLPIIAIATPPEFLHNRVVLAGAPGGLFLSTDAGASWKALVFPNPPPTVSSLAFSPNFEKDETVFAGTMEDGIFISRDGGERWAAWNFGLLDLNIFGLAISPNFASDETIFAAVETGIFRSTNGGRAWREVELPFGYEPVLSLAISPRFGEDRILYAGTESHGLWVTHDEGKTWNRLANGMIDEPVNGLQMIGHELFAFTSTSIWHSTDHGATWVNRIPEDKAGVELSSALVVSLVKGRAVIVGCTDGKIDVFYL